MPQNDMEKNYLDIAYEKEKNSFFGFFVKHFRIIYIFLFIIVIFGTYSLFTLPREAEPEIKIPYAVVTTIYPGANPDDVEDLVTNKIENKIKNLENLKQFNSNSSTGFSSIFVEFEAEADLEKCFAKLKEQVDNAKPMLPSEAEDPTVTEISFSDIPIVTYSLFGQYNDLELKNYADIVKKELESIKDVSSVTIIGGLEREFQIVVDPVKIASYNISLGQIVNVISKENFNLPSGDIEIDNFKYNVRIKGKFYDINDLYDVVITNFNDTPIYLHDIAKIIDGYKEKKGESRLGLKKQDAKNAISLQVNKKTGGNVIKIVDKAQLTIDKLQNNNILPNDLNILKTNDNAVFIREDLKRLGTSGLQTMILIVILLVAILGLRGALITGLSVPFAFLMIFIILSFQGMTLNSIVLFSLVLALGLMVDNSIIIIEGIKEYIYHHNKTPQQAAILSIWNYKWAITSGTMTTVSAFAPMLLVSGIMGEFMSIIPKVVSTALLSSLFVSLILIPTLAARNYKRLNGKKEGKKHLYKNFENTLNHVKKYYTVFLSNILKSKKKRRITIYCAFTLFFLSVLLPITGVLKIEMFPKVDFDYFVINIELPVGSSLQKTNLITKLAEDKIKDIQDLDNYVTNIGSSFNLGAGQGSSNRSNLSSIIVNLADEENRNEKSYAIAENLRKKLVQINGAKITLDELTGGPPTGAPIEVRIFGPDISKSSRISEDVIDILKNINGVINIKDSLEESTGDFVFTINREKAKFYGLDATSIAFTIRQALFGVQSTQVTINNDDIDVTVKYNPDNFNNIDDIKNILINTNKGVTVKLQEVANVTLEPSLLGIGHMDGDRVVSVSAYLEKGAVLKDILNNFNNESKKIALDQDYSIEIGGENEDIQKSYTEMFLSMIVAVFLIILILVLQFNSFKQPFIIIFTLPLAIIGAIFGLAVLRLPFSLPAFIGIVSLSGIVVNDAIVLIDRINKNLAQKVEFFEAIIEAGIARVQPIFLTSATTIAGILPLAISDEMWSGLGFSIIFGLLFATFLTLVMVPIVFVSLCYKDYKN